MYPMFYLQNFGQLIEGEEVFVMMPFHDDFKTVWTDIYKPAIKALNLKPYRVDVRTAGDSIMTDILDGIARSRLLLADVTDVDGNRPNGNVLYELGITHACRVPETVIVVRSGDLALPYDLQYIRVRKYDRADPEKAISEITTYLNDALKDGVRLKDNLIKTAWAAMDNPCRWRLATHWLYGYGDREPGAHIPDLKPLLGSNVKEEERRIFSRMQELGVIEPFEQKISIGGQLSLSQQECAYKLTTLGNAVAQMYVIISKPAI